MLAEGITAPPEQLGIWLICAVGVLYACNLLIGVYQKLWPKEKPRPNRVDEYVTRGELKEELSDQRQQLNDHMNRMEKELRAELVRLEKGFDVALIRIEKSLEIGTASSRQRQHDTLNALDAISQSQFMIAAALKAAGHNIELPRRVRNDPPHDEP